MEELKKGQTLITTGIYFFKKKRIFIILFSFQIFERIFLIFFF